MFHPAPVDTPSSPAPVAESAVAPGVRVSAPGRLHLGFLDPSASLGRRFGSLGLVIDGLETVVEIGDAYPGGADPGDELMPGGDRFSAAADIPAGLARAELARAAAHLDRLRQAALDRAAQDQAGAQAADPALLDRLRRPLHLHLADALPAHAGLGSGTQLGLAVGRAWAQWQGLALSTLELARITGRGLRSGVGIAGFDLGGLLLDGGPSAQGPAPLLSRLDLPADWRVLLVFDPQH
ncbi:MAG: hypothetical protein RL722_2207, partial [Pseudomonadota bacterium]